MCLPFRWAPGSSLQKSFFCRGQTVGLNNKRDIKHPAWEKWSTGQTLLQRSCCRHESLMRGVSRLTWKHLHTNSRGGEASCISVNSVLRLCLHQIYMYGRMPCLTLRVRLRPLCQFFFLLEPSVKAVFKHSMTFSIYHLPRKPPLFCSRLVSPCQLHQVQRLGWCELLKARGAFAFLKVQHNNRSYDSVRLIQACLSPVSSVVILFPPIPGL